jgi:hypothetical protein
MGLLPPSCRPFNERWSGEYYGRVLDSTDQKEGGGTPHGGDAGSRLKEPVLAECGAAGCPVVLCRRTGTMGEMPSIALTIAQFNHNSHRPQFPTCGKR